MRDTLHAEAKLQDRLVGADFRTRQEILLTRSLKTNTTKAHASEIGLEYQDGLFI
jgi:hypothetical protein